MASRFCRTYAKAISDCACQVNHLEAFNGKTFAIDSDGDAAQFMGDDPCELELHLAYFLTDELEDRLLDLDWTTLRAADNEELNPSFAVNGFLDVLVTYGEQVHVSVRCTNEHGFEHYLETVGHAGAP